MSELLADAVKAAGATLDVPGTPRTLRLDSVEAGGNTCTMRWSFLDPETTAADPVDGHDRRLEGSTSVRPQPGPVDEAARACWERAQLDAARLFADHVDADWTPSEPYVHRTWGVDEAWSALLEHLAARGATVCERAGDIVVTGGGDTCVYRFDPAQWAQYLNVPEPSTDSGYVVPVGVGKTDGLPDWVVDELWEAAGAWGGAALIDGQLVRLGPRGR